MKKILLSSLVLASFLYAQASPKFEVTQEDVKVQNEVSDASTKDITPKSLDEFFEEFANEFEISYGQTQNGKTFYTGIGNAAVKENDPQFAQALEIAYQRAILDLQKEFIKDAFGRTATSKISSYESDQSTNNREFEELPKGGAFGQIWDKITQLAGAKLDNALKDLGVNTQGLSEEQKKTLFKDSFLQKTLTTAFGSMQGLVPVQTLVTHKRGEYQIGVIAVVSDKTRQLARDMQYKRKSLIQGKGGKKLLEYLPKDNKGFLNEYGIRLVYDESGAPIIISYGNWGFVPNANNRITNSLEKQAKETASSKADAAILEFINVSVSMSDERLSGDDIQQVIKQSTNLNDGSVQQEDQTFTNIIDKVNQTIKSQASGQLKGIRTLKSWSTTSDNGVEHVGVVRYYSYANVENTNQALNPKSSSKSGGSGQKAQRKSNVVNTIDDF